MSPLEKHAIRKFEISAFDTDFRFMILMFEKNRRSHLKDKN